MSSHKEPSTHHLCSCALKESQQQTVPTYGFHRISISGGSGSNNHTPHFSPPLSSSSIATGGGNPGRMISRQSSFSVISNEEHEELEWFDAAEVIAGLPGSPISLSTSSFTIEGHRVLCTCNTSKLIAYYEDRVKQLETDLMEVRGRLDQQSLEQVSIYGVLIKLIQDIVTLGINAQVQLLTQILGRSGIDSTSPAAI